MKIGIITDIHNNLPALEAVLETFSDCDQIVCCGDVIGIGPYPEETVQRLMRVPSLLSVRGNHDRYLLEGMPSEVPNDEHMELSEMGMHRWEHARLSAESVAFLRAMPLQAEFEADGLRVAVQHYCMDEHNAYVHYTPNPTSADLDRMFADVSADVILYGHDHAPSVRRTDRALYVNCGSLGCPGRERNVARAGILEIRDGRAEFAPLAVRYDAARAVAEIDRLRYPSADEIKLYFFGISWAEK